MFRHARVLDELSAESCRGRAVRVASMLRRKNPKGLHQKRSRIIILFFSPLGGGVKYCSEDFVLGCPTQGTKLNNERVVIEWTKQNSRFHPSNRPVDHLTKARDPVTLLWFGSVRIDSSKRILGRKRFSKRRQIRFQKKLNEICYVIQKWHQSYWTFLQYCFLHSLSS
jgi:hypothetical protein